MASIQQASRIRLQTSKMNRLPQMSPIEEDKPYNPRSKVKPRKPQNTQQQNPRESEDTELKDLISEYLSNTPPNDGQLSYACPCCKEANEESYKKRKEKDKLGNYEPLHFPEAPPGSEEELKSDTHLISNLTLIRDETMDLVSQQKDAGSNMADYSLNPYKGTYLHKDATLPSHSVPEKSVFLDDPPSRSSRNLEQEIINANSKFSKSMNKLQDTYYKIQ